MFPEHPLLPIEFSFFSQTIRSIECSHILKHSIDRIVCEKKEKFCSGVDAMETLYRWNRLTAAERLCLELVAISKFYRLTVPIAPTPKENFLLINSIDRIFS